MEAPASSKYTPYFHFQETFENVCCCTNSDKEDAESNSKAPPITIGAFYASGFYPLLVISVDAIQSQHAIEVEPDHRKELAAISGHGNKKNEDERLDDSSRIVGKAQVRAPGT